MNSERKLIRYVKPILICSLMLLLLSNWIHVPVYGANYNVTITIEGRDEAGGCRIRIDGITYRNNDVVSLSAGTHTCEAITPSGWGFLQWLYAGNTPVTDPYNPSTTFTVNGNGVIGAEWGPIVTFYASPGGGGTISVYYYGASPPFTETYSNGQSGVIKGFSSELRANPSAGYTFSSWSTTGSVSVDSPTKTPTLWSGDAGPGTVTANFQAQQTYSINLKSDGTDGTYNTGTITFAGTSYNLPTTVSKTAGSYSITGNPPTGYKCLGFRSGQGVSVLDPNAQSTTVTISGNGYLEAVWYPVGRYPVLLVTATTDGQTNVGSITVNGTVYSPGTIIWMGRGSSSVTGNPPSGYTFDRWETSGLVTVANPTSQSTTASATGAGSLKAWFKPTAVPPPETGNLQVYVKDSSNNPIAGASVISTSQPSGQPQLTGATDLNGFVTFNGIKTGSYTIQASKTGYQSGSLSATVNSGQTTTITINLTPPPTIIAPSSLTANAISSSQINLAWTDNSPDESDFHIERRTSSSSWVEITTVPADTQSYSDNGLSPSSTYYYRVRAHRHSDNTYSSYSNEASAMTLPKPTYPIVITVQGPSSAKVELYVDDLFKQSVAGGNLASLEFEIGTSHKIKLITPSLKDYIVISLQVENEQLTPIIGEIMVERSVKIFVLYISAQDLISWVPKIKETIVKEFTDPQTYLKLSNLVREGINEYPVIIEVPASFVGSVGNVIKLYFRIERIASIIVEADLEKNMNGVIEHINRFAGSSIIGGISTIGCLIAAGLVGLPTGGAGAIPVIGACGAGGALTSFLLDKLQPTITERLGYLSNILMSSIIMWLISAIQRAKNFFGISGGSNVTITVIDPQGRYAGFISAGADKIPDAIYSGISSHPQVVMIPNPIGGDYKIVVGGREGGEFRLEFLTFSEGVVTYNRTISSSIGDGEEKEFSIMISSQGGKTISGNIASIINSIIVPNNIIIGDFLTLKMNISDPEGIRQVNVNLLDPKNRWYNFTALYSDKLYVLNIATSDFLVGIHKLYISILDNKGAILSQTYDFNVLGKLVLNGIISKTEVITGEKVEVTLNLVDQYGKPVELASVNITYADKVISTDYVGEGTYTTVLDTSVLEGSYVIVAKASKQMYLPAQVGLALIVRPWWWPYLPYLIATPLAVALVFTLWRVLKRSKPPIIKPPEGRLIKASPEVIQALKGAKTSLEKGMYASAVISASERLRSDLINRLKLKTSSTNEEIVKTLNRSDLRIDSGGVRSILKLADRCKFDEYEPSHKEAREAIEKASNILRKLQEKET